MAGPTVDVPTPRSAGTVIVAVDVSQSMTATDVAPSRLQAAKKVATTLIEAQPDSVDIGVVAFGAGALSAGEPSADHARARRCRPPHPLRRHLAHGGDPGQPLGHHGEGSDPAGGGRRAPDLGYWGSATVVLVSDGEAIGEGDCDRGRRHGPRPGRGRAHRGRRRRDRGGHHRRRPTATPCTPRSTRMRSPRSPRPPVAGTTRRPRWPTSRTSPTRSTAGSPSLRSRFRLPAHSVASRPCCSPWARPAPCFATEG